MHANYLTFVLIVQECLFISWPILIEELSIYMQNWSTFDFQLTIIFSSDHSIIYTDLATCFMFELSISLI